MKKLILFSNTSFTAYQFRGKLIEFLIRRGYGVTVLCFDDQDQTRIESLGAQFVALKHDRVGTNPIQELRLIFKLHRFIRDENPDVLLNYTIKPTIYGSLVSFFMRSTRVVSMLPGLGYLFIGDRLKVRILRFIALILYRIAFLRNHAVLFLNPQDRDAFTDDFKVLNREKTRLLFSEGLDLEHYEFSALASGPTRVLMIARLLRDKGIYEYLEVADRIKSIRPEVQFVLIGVTDSNPSSLPRASLDDYIRRGVIEYYPETSDIRPQLRACTLFALPSYREGMSRVVMEALAMGRPCVVSDVPGCRELVESQVNGMRVPVKDADALTQAILSYDSLSLDEKTKLARGARSFAEANLDHRILNAQLVGWLEEPSN